MTPLVFGPSERRLFGVFHPEATGATGRRAVLLCNPFGHEAIRIHRLFRVLADRLARAGCAVMRFDYFGTGDSSGDDEDGELDGWREDIHAAHDELRRRCHGTGVSWLAPRLGASIAIQACRALGVGPERLVLWDPIIDGAAYARLLRVKHVEALELSYCIPDPAWRRQLPRAEDTATLDEAIGFAVSQQLSSQLNALTPNALDLPAGLDTRVVADPQDAAVAQWVAAQQARGAAVRDSPLSHTLVWTSDPQPNDAVVPTEALQRLLAELGD